MSEEPQNNRSNIVYWATIVSTLAAVIGVYYQVRDEPGFVRSPTVTTVSEDVLSSTDARLVRVRGFAPATAKETDERFLALIKGNWWYLPRLSILWRSERAGEVSETALYRFPSSATVGEFDIDHEKSLLVAAISDSYPANGEPHNSIFLLDYPQKFATSYGVRCTTSVEPKLGTETEVGVPPFADTVRSVSVGGDVLVVSLLTPCWWVSIGSAVFELPANGSLSVATASKEAVAFQDVAKRDEVERSLEARGLRYEYTRKDIVTGTILKYDARKAAILSERFRIVYADPKSVADTVALAQKDGFIDIQFTTYQGADLPTCTRAMEAALRDKYQTSFYCSATDPKPEAGVISIIRRSVETTDLKSMPLRELRDKTDSLRAQGYLAAVPAEFDKCERCYLLNARSVFIDLRASIGRTYQLQPAGVFAARKEGGSEPASPTSSDVK